MTYAQSLDFIHSIVRFGSKPGLRRVERLLALMGNPQNSLKFIHVAGTNGKGSTCTMLSHILTHAGYRTGLYISPFVLDFRERIQLNNRMISPEDLAESTTRVKAFWDIMDAEGEPATEFEVVVAVAFDYFVRMGCDVVVLEVGMGGRFDATNVIGCPLVSVITSISIDHTEYLGDTIEKIAFEKCGIIKPGGVTVCYPKQNVDALGVIMEQCAMQNNRLFLAANAEVLGIGLDGADIRYDGLDIHIPLPGEHQIWNTVTVLETVKAISLSGITVRSQDIVDGIAATHFPARLEILGRSPLLLLDGAHNLSGAQALEAALLLLSDKKIHTVIGMMADKDVDGCLAAILPHCVTVTTVTPDNPRALPAAQLAERAKPYCGQVYCADSCQQAFDSALARCGPDDVLLLCGSLYLASELRPIATAYVENRIKK